TVILRDDDTCALTPRACLERLYRPFLDRGLPVNLAVIPEVRTDVRTDDGAREGFLAAGLPPAGPLGRWPAIASWRITCAPSPVSISRNTAATTTGSSLADPIASNSRGGSSAARPACATRVSRNRSPSSRP